MSFTRLFRCPLIRTDPFKITTNDTDDGRRGSKLFTRHGRIFCYRVSGIPRVASYICAFVCRSSRRMPVGGGSRSPTDTINLFDYRPTPRPPQQSRRTTSVPPPVVTPSPVETLNVWPARARSIVVCLRRVRSLRYGSGGVMSQV